MSELASEPGNTVRRLLRDPGGAIGTGLIAVLLVCAALALVWTPFDPTLVDPYSTWLPPLTDPVPLDELLPALLKRIEAL